MNVKEAIMSRRSVRNYEGTAIEQEKLLDVLEAGRLAPSAGNRQGWRFVAVTNKEVIQKMQVACNDQKFVGEAPCVLAIISTQERVMPCGVSAEPVDCSIALSYMNLQAEELGLSMCWLGAFNQDKAKEVLQTKEGETVIAVTPLGYAKTIPDAKPRKEAEEVFTFMD